MSEQKKTKTSSVKDTIDDAVNLSSTITDPTELSNNIKRLQNLSDSSQSSRRKIVFIIIAFIVVLATLLTTWIIGITSGVSIFQTILYALETEEVSSVSEETNEVSDLPQENIESIIVQDKPGLDTALYRKALNILYEDVPSDIRDLDMNSISMDGWSAKSWALAYLLAAEICMRDEINPSDSEVYITPELLLGEWSLEGGLTLAGVEDCASRDLIPIDTYCTWVSSHNLNMSTDAAVGPFGQFLSLYSTTDDAIGSIYISRLENPDLDNEKRAVIGSRSEIYSGHGRYVTEAIWEGSSLASASLVELQNSIKEGTLDITNKFAYGSRPACYYLPDAMYTHALGIRAGLQGKTYNQAVNGYGADSNLATIQNLLSCTTEKTSSKVLSDVMLCFSLGQYVGNKNTGFLYYISDNDAGVVGKLYADMIRYNISPITVNKYDSVQTKQNELLCSGAGNFSSFIATGYMDRNYLYETLYAAYDLETTVSTPTDTNIYNRLEDLGMIKDLPIDFTPNMGLYYKAFEATQDKDSYWSFIIDGYDRCTCDITYLTYGATCLNAGYIIEKRCRSSIEYLYSMYPKALADSDVIDGITCLGSDCACIVHNQDVIEVTSYSQMNTALYKESTISQDIAVNILNTTVKSDVTYHEGKSITHSINGVYTCIGYDNLFTGLKKPVHDNCSYATYTTVVHKGVDIISAKGILDQEIYPVDYGVIVGIYSYPYNVSKIYSIGDSTGAWTGMGGYGNCVVVLHETDDGKFYYSLYAHLNAFGHIKVGTLVGPNTVLGYGGCTGKSTGSHLHLELRIKSDIPGGVYTHPSNFTISSSIAEALEGTSDYATY